MSEPSRSLSAETAHCTISSTIVGLLRLVLSMRRHTAFGASRVNYFWKKRMRYDTSEIQPIAAANGEEFLSRPTAGCAKKSFRLTSDSLTG